MNARQVHSILAYGVKNPHLIGDWEKGGQVDGQLCLPNTFDFRSLANFSGLAVKVRHNGLRLQYPLTFRLMNVGGMDIDLFASYAQHNSRGELKLEADLFNRATRLLDFFQLWRDPARHEHNILWDVFRHEHAIVGAKKAGNFQTEESTQLSQDSFGAETVLRLAQGLKFNHLDFDPEHVETVLARMSPSLDQIQPAESYFGYLSKAGGRVRLFRLNTPSYYLLNSIDGHTPLFKFAQKFQITNEKLIIELASHLVDRGLAHAKIST